jgi:hypothetical protein
MFLQIVDIIFFNKLVRRDNSCMIDDRRISWNSWLGKRKKTEIYIPLQNYSPNGLAILFYKVLP